MNNFAKAALLIVGALFYFLSMPPFSIGVLSILGVALMALPKVRSFGVLWLMGIVLQISLTFWLAKVSAFGVVAISVFGGLFFALPFWAYARWGRPWAVALLWVALEALRSFLGWGWLPVAAAFVEDLNILSWVRLGGETLLGFLTVAAAFALAELFSNTKDCRSRILVLLWLSLLVGGGFFLQTSESLTTHPDPRLPSPIRIGLVQPNIPMSIGKTPQELMTEIGVLEDLTTPLKEKTDIIFWPEQQTPWAINSDERMRIWAETGAKYLRADIIAGALWDTDGKFYNAVAIVSEDKGLSDTFYAKRRLVPFGEYVPFAEFKWMRSLTPIVESFSAGKNPVVLEAKGWRFWPLVCYEDTFPYLSAGAKGRADALLVVTNDGWFGPHAREQHLAHSILRSVETGLPLVRVSNDGISGIIYPDGRKELMEKQQPLSKILELRSTSWR